MTQPNFNNAYEKIKSDINKIDSRDKIIKTIEYYYVCTSKYGQSPLSNETKNKICEMETQELQKLMVELMNESVNKDMCHYISTGVNPKIANN